MTLDQHSPTTDRLDQLSFPRASARSQNFTLGAPRNPTVSADGQRVLFLRSAGPTDPAQALWLWDAAEERERALADPAELLAGAHGSESQQERARRERSRERASGIVGYSADPDLTRVVYAVGGALFVTEIASSATRELPVPAPVIDPRMDPTGSRVGFVCGTDLMVCELATDEVTTLAAAESEYISWGLAEFVAAEEMERSRGFWFSPDGDRLLAARVDVSCVHTWHIADPAQPQQPPATVRYPAAGTPNAEVRLFVIDLAGRRSEVSWDRQRFPYLLEVHWGSAGAPLLSVQNRAQTCIATMTLDAGNDGDATATTLVEQHGQPWVEPCPGTPAWSPDGRLLRVLAEGDAHRLFADEVPLSPPQLQVRAVLEVGESDVLVSGSGTEPTEIHLYRIDYQGGLHQVSASAGVHSARRGGHTLVQSSASMDYPGGRTEIHRPGAAPVTIASHAATPAQTPNVRILTVGQRALRCALVLPATHAPGQRLPVLLDPYGGPHAQRVLAASNAYQVPQWFADQGFAVLITDGRGSPGRGPEWEAQIHRDLAEVTLADQLDALEEVARRFPDLDTGRVAIRGWSYGGYLAALAVMRRPDRVHAAVAGAPVVDWRLYDTHYTERYLGHPDEHPEAYQANSLLTDAAELQRPLMLIHGLADDNVVCAHSLRLSTALLEAGRPHSVLPLTGVTHMPSQEQVAENLMLLQVEFLQRSLPLSTVDG